MKIQLTDLNYHDKILISETINYPKSYVENTDIISLENVQVEGKIYQNYEDDRIISLDVKGIMYLVDAITTEIVPYNFKIKIEEKLENSLKTLDLIEFLWQYIVLEIPIRYTISDTKELKSRYQGIYSEEEVREVDNPFKDFFKE